jgi:hypothetical protein
MKTPEGGVPTQPAEPVEPKRTSLIKEGDGKIEGEDQKPLSAEEIKKMVNETGGDVLEEGQSALLVSFSDADAALKFCDRLDSGRKSIDKAIIYVLKETRKEQGASLNEALEKFGIEPFRRKLADYKIWREEIEKQGIKSFHYVDGFFKHHVEGNYKLKGGSYGDNAYISPRFVRVNKGTGEGGLGNGVCAVADWSNKRIGNVILPVVDEKEIGKNFQEWVLINNICNLSARGMYDPESPTESGKITYENYRERVIEIIEETLVKKLDNQYLENEISSSAREETPEELRSLILNDTHNYLAFLDRSYMALERFITKLESYKEPT